MSCEPHRAVEIKETILVVEDSASVREMLKHILEHAGYKVLMAEDGEQGYEVWFSNRNKIDLVISDLEMPRMRGNVLTARIKAEEPDAKVVIFSGTASLACAPLADLLIQKPGSPSEILTAIARQLAKSTPEP